MNWYSKPTLYIHQSPIGAPRPRARKAGGFARVYNPPEYTAWKTAAANDLKAYWKHEPINGGFVNLAINVYFKRPKTLMRKKDPTAPIFHNKRPDADNVAKAIIDAMVDAGVMTDDKFVVQLTIRKYYCSKDFNESERIEIFILHTKNVASIEPESTPHEG
jgi:Holliday junction resolvase RusA-like endonuclease